ncbi:MAG: hypothetical protein V7K97_23920 [Nostoc sp.]
MMAIMFCDRLFPSSERDVYDGLRLRLNLQISQIAIQYGSVKQETR